MSHTIRDNDEGPAHARTGSEVERMSVLVWEKVRTGLQTAGYKIFKTNRLIFINLTLRGC